MATDGSRARGRARRSPGASRRGASGGDAAGGRAGAVATRLRAAERAASAAAPGAERLEQRPLQPEQPLLDVEPARVTDELPVRTHDAGAREDDRDPVAVHHGPHRACGLRCADALRERAVRRRLAVPDLRELMQDAHVEVRDCAQVELEVEGASLPFEVLVQLETDAVERLRRTEDARAER